MTGYRCDRCRFDGGTYCSTYTDEKGVYRTIAKPYVFCKASRGIWVISKKKWEENCLFFRKKVM